MLNELYEPHWQRLVSFDAITAYNPYDSTRLDHGGQNGALHYLADVADLYSRYQATAATAGQLLIPSVIPGYNDRGVRLEANHYAIAREYGTLESRSFFWENLVQLADPFLNPRTPIFTVTSWNEWNEGTQIEPTNNAPPVNLDLSESGVSYTEGHYYRGYGCQHLEELAEFVKIYKEKGASYRTVRPVRTGFHR